jgi:hypothetical protein
MEIPYQKHIEQVTCTTEKIRKSWCLPLFFSRGLGYVTDLCLDVGCFNTALRLITKLRYKYNRKINDDRAVNQLSLQIQSLVLNSLKYAVVWLAASCSLPQGV